MVDPLSVTVGAGVTVVVMLALLGVFLAGYQAARRPEHVVDMQEVTNYARHKNSTEALSQDVEADGGSNG